ncbi:MAG: diphthamide biosynthesis enzyme Dph2 [Candidatus Hodarchaeales archaeon]|jgi:2-(3-amino-3-carboxypropyl)histidine synthase
MSDYELEIDQIVQKIRENSYNSVLIQFPEGMLDKPLKTIKETLSKENIKVYVAGDPSYGICDLAVDLAKKLKCELLIHFGHSEFGFQNQVDSALSEPLDVILVPAYYLPPQELDYNPIIREIKKRNWKTVSLAATIQHIKNLDKLEEILVNKNITVHRFNSGQVLGCHVTTLHKSNNVSDGFISVHAGYFHTHGILLSTNKPLIQFDPYNGSITCYEELDHNKVVQKRFALLTQAKKAKYWGILGSSKLGQLNLKMISNVQSLLAERELPSITVVAENINPHVLANFSYIDAWVVTACPRLAIDDKIRFNKPVVTFREFLCIFDQVKWENLLEQGFF